MRIIIAGDGDTGSHLARTLSIENQDIVLIGNDAGHLADLESTGNFITFNGSPLSVANLRECGITECDLFVAVMPDENSNIVAAQLAKGCGVSRCVARIDSPRLLEPKALEIIKASGIDATIYPEALAADDIRQFIPENWARDWFEIHGGELIVTGVKIGRNSEFNGKKLRDIPSVPRRFHVAAIRRGSDIVVPRGDTVIMVGDIVYFTVLPGDVDYLCEVCGCRKDKVNRVMITGAGQVTETLLSTINGRYDITVIESDPERCQVIAAKYPRTVVVNSPVNDVATLKEEGIEKCDMFLALTGSSETNIVSCMVAREHGVSKTVARIEDLPYIPEAEALSIDKIINKKLLNVGKIINSLIDISSVNAKCMMLDNAEIIELRAEEGSKIVSRPICELTLPKEITIGGLIRDGKGYLVEGRTRIQPGDHVMIFCITGSLSKVERLFR